MTDIQESTGPEITPDSLRGQASELMASEGYMTGNLKNTNPAKYERLNKEITELYNRADGIENPPPKEGEPEPEPQGPSLMERALKEMEALKKLGFDGPLPSDIQEYHVEGWTQQRLIAEGNFEELKPLVTADLKKVQPSYAHLFEQILNIPDMDPVFREKFSEAVVEYVFNVKHANAKGNS